MLSPMHTSSGRKPAFALMMFLVVLSFVLAACGSDTTGNTSTGPASVAPPNDLIKKGELQVGSDTTYAPMEFIDATSNQYTGFDVDLLTAMAQKMGLKANIKKTGFDTIFDDLSNKRFDMVASSVTISDERKAKFDFVPYFNAGESLLVAKGNPKHLKTTADLCGLNIGVQVDTVEKKELDGVSNTCKQQGKGEINQTVLQSQSDVIQLLSTGRVVATYQDSPVTDYYNKINPGQFEIGGPVVNFAPYGLTVRKGDSSMLNALQAAFNAVKADGTYNKLFTKWNLTNSQKLS